jgi:arylsulfatase
MPTPNRPNILILHADQHRYDCLGAYGNPDVQTPNIDALAADGVRYNNSFCPFPVCTPSRYSLLSSQYVRQHLGWTNHCTLPPAIPTFPRVLRDAGYRTTAVGKMHFTPTYLDVGFETMLLAEQDGPGRFDDDYHRWLHEEGLVDGIDLMDQRQEYRDVAPAGYWDSVGALTSDLDEAHHSTTWIADRAMDTLEGWEQADASSGGHLLMVGFIKPHHPFDPPEPWNELYDPAALTLLPGWSDAPLPADVARNAGYFPHVELTEAKLRRAMAYYYATISQIDHHVGRMVELLKRRGLYQNTLIVYTSDHGDYMGFHHLLLKGGPMYDPLVKVPLIVKLPGHTRAGEISDELVTNLDVAPTLLEAAGCALPGAMQGLDLQDQSVMQSRTHVFSENWAGQEIMVRSDREKLLWCQNPDQSQFFDLSEDPLETHNRLLDPACADSVAALKERLLEWATFTARTQTYLDYTAPVVNEVSGEQAQSMATYFSERVRDITAQDRTL